MHSYSLLPQSSCDTHYTYWLTRTRHALREQVDTIGLNLSQNSSWFREEADMTHLHGIHNQICSNLLFDFSLKLTSGCVCDDGILVKYTAVLYLHTSVRTELWSVFDFLVWNTKWEVRQSLSWIAKLQKKYSKSLTVWIIYLHGR